MATIKGTKRDDFLQGTSAADTISGLGGNDTINPGFGADRIDGGSGDDIVLFTGVMSSSPPPPDGAIIGGIGFDTIDLSAVSPGTIRMSENVIYVTVGTQRFQTAGIELIQFGAGNDFLTPDLFYEGAAIDIRTGGGNDYLSGSGNYRFYGEDGEDYILIAGSFGKATSGVADGGAGNDTLGLISGFTVDLAAGTARSFQASYTVAGFEAVSAYSDSIVLGDDGANVIFVRDIFDSETGAVHFEGRGGNDLLTGSLGADVLDGGKGADVINGSDGADTLTGGTGADLFVFGENDSPADNSDRITDFVAGVDRIDLSALDAFDFIGKRAFSGEAGELHYRVIGRTTLIEGDIDGNGSADFVLQLDGRQKLTAASFVLRPESSGADAGDAVAFGMAHAARIDTLHHFEMLV